MGPRMSRSSTIIDDSVEGVKLPPVHPGEVLREEFMAPFALTTDDVARACGLDRVAVEAIRDERSAVTAEAALRLGRYFGTSPELWLGIQMQFDIERAEDALHDEIQKITPRPLAAAE